MNDVTIWVDDIWREGAAPEPPLTVSQWADENRLLPDLSAEPGRWRTSRTPYLREIMDCLSANDPTERVVFIKGAQLGGTEAGLNFLGYVIHHAPGLMLMVQPTMDAVRRSAIDWLRLLRPARICSISARASLLGSTHSHFGGSQSQAR